MRRRRYAAEHVPSFAFPSPHVTAEWSCRTGGPNSVACSPLCADLPLTCCHFCFTASIKIALSTSARVNYCSPHAFFHTVSPLFLFDIVLLL